jgi:YD repeat-containing protein
VAATDALGRTTDFRFDAFGRNVQIVMPAATRGGASPSSGSIFLIAAPNCSRERTDRFMLRA